MSEQLPAETAPAAAAEVQALVKQIDLGDPGSILRFGAATQSRAAAAADAMLGGARNQETGQAGQTLSGLLSTLKGFDVTKIAEKPNLLARLFTQTGAEATRIIQQYEGVKGQVESIGDRLVFAGALQTEAAQPIGTLTVIEAPNLEEATAFFENDPFVVRGVFQSHEISRWNWALNNPDKRGQ